MMSQRDGEESEERKAILLRALELIENGRIIPRRGFTTILDLGDDDVTTSIVGVLLVAQLSINPREMRLPWEMKKLQQLSDSFEHLEGDDPLVSDWLRCVAMLTLLLEEENRRSS